jgi:hypothetical protein
MQNIKKITSSIFNGLTALSILSLGIVCLTSTITTSAQGTLGGTNNTTTTTGTRATNASGITIGNNVLCGGDGNQCPVLGKAANATPSKEGLSVVILAIARFITNIAGAIAVVIIVISGVQRMNISDADAAKTSNNNLTNAAIGLAIAILAYTIVGVLSVFLVGSFF